MLQFSVVGNLGGDAELHQENGVSYVSFKVAHNERYQKSDGNTVDKTLWVSCIINGDAGNLRQYLVKGQQVYVSGDGDIRTYHSQQQRCMVAGINIRVRHIELLGARPDAVPQSLIDDEGIIYRVNKFYNIDTAKGKTLHDRAGNTFMVDENGWVTTPNAG